MRISTIRYRQSKNLGNYQSAHLEAEAEINPVEDPAEALAVLKQWVIDELEGKRQDREAVENPF